MAASRKSEVTKLLTVTLDKIHESKRTKSGPNLRKSLLVASVLHKARDVYVTEIKNVRSNHSASSLDSQPVSPCTDTPTTNSTTSTITSVSFDTSKTSAPESSIKTVAKSVAVKRKFTSQQSVIEVEGEDALSDSHSDSHSDYHDNYNSREDVTTDNSQSSENEECTSTQVKKRSFFGAKGDTRLDYNVANDFLEELASESDCTIENKIDNVDFHTLTDKENSPPCQYSNSNLSESSIEVVKSDSAHPSSHEPHGRCLKRRSSIKYDDDSHSELDRYSLSSSNISPSSYVPRKRVRMTSVDCGDSEPSSIIVCTTADPTTTTQINNLVRIFTNSFDVGDNTHTYEKPTELNTFATLCRESIALTA